MIAALGGEARTYGAWQQPYRAATTIITETGLAVSMLNIGNIMSFRDANYFIEQMETVSTFDADFIAQRVGEARFLRAYMYFEMVKRYGGVPILIKAQTIDTPADELFVPRNSEKEVYDFVISEMDALSTICLKVMPMQVAQPNGPL